MPTAYISIAISAVLLNSLITTVSNRFSFLRILTGNHIMHIVILSGLGFLLYQDFISGWLTIVLYIYISLYALLTVTYFYQYCQSLLSIRDAKRLYAYIGAGAIAGGIVGGYITSIFIDIIGSAGLVWLSAGILFISLLLYRVAYNLQYEGDESPEVFITKNVRRRNAFYALKNGHVANVAILMGIGVIVSRLVDYQLNYLVMETITDGEDLASFFGFWFSSINIIGFALQMLVVSKFVDRWGLEKSLQGLPVLLIGGLIAVIFLPTLALGIAIKSIDGSLKQSLYKTGTELVIMPLSNNVRRRAKTLIDVVIDSLATGIAGIAIYVLSTSLSLPLSATLIITVMLCILWIYFITRSSQSYNKALLNRVVDTPKLSKPNEENRNIIGEYIQANKAIGKGQSESLIQLLQNPDHYVRSIALRRLVDQYGVQERTSITTMIHDPHLAIRKDAFDAIVDWIKNPQELNELEQPLDLTNKAILISALADSMGQNIPLQKRYKIADRIDKVIAELPTITDPETRVQINRYIYRAIATVRHRAKFEQVLQMINHPIDPDDQAVAIDAISYGENRSFYHKIRRNSITAANTVGYYKYLATFPKLTVEKLEFLAKHNTAKELMTILPCAAYIDTQDNIDFLQDLLDHENLRIRRIALQTINNCRKKFPYLNYRHIGTRRRLTREIKTLRKLLISQISITEDPTLSFAIKAPISRGISRETDRSILRIMIYIALFSQSTDITYVYNALKTKKRDIALDVLDNMLPYSLKKQLIPLLDVVIHQRYQMQALKQLKIRMVSQRRIYKFLRSLTDIKLKSAMLKV